jgi:phosphohistidine phosphatase
MKRLGLGFDLCIASPSVRVRETLGEVEAAFGPLKASFDQRIYLADPDDLLELVRAAPEVANSLLLVGHNPGLEMLTLSLAAPGVSPLRGDVEIKYPTATLAELSLPVERWADVTPARAQLIRFVRPRDLDPELGPDSE